MYARVRASLPIEWACGELNLGPHAYQAIQSGTGKPTPCRFLSGSSRDLPVFPPLDAALDRHERTPEWTPHTVTRAVVRKSCEKAKRLMRTTASQFFVAVRR